MTKVVINCSYGGFGLSDKAMRLYAAAKGYYFLPATFEGYASIYQDLGDRRSHVSVYDIDRSDPDLIDIVEKMGDEAGGYGSFLGIVDVPAGTKYYIHEYDGIESIVTEADMKWRVA